MIAGTSDCITLHASEGRECGAAAEGLVVFLKPQFSQTEACLSKPVSITHTHPYAILEMQKCPQTFGQRMSEDSG